VGDPPSLETQNAAGQRYLKYLGSLAGCLICGVLVRRHIVFHGIREFLDHPRAGIVARLTTVREAQDLTSRMRTPHDLSRHLDHRFTLSLLDSHGLVPRPRDAFTHGRPDRPVITHPTDLDDLRFGSPDDVCDAASAAPSRDVRDALPISPTDGAASREAEYSAELESVLDMMLASKGGANTPLEKLEEFLAVGLAESTSNAADPGSQVCDAPTCKNPFDTHVVVCHECWSAASKNQLRGAAVANGNWGLSHLVLNGRDYAQPGFTPPRVLQSGMAFATPITHTARVWSGGQVMQRRITLVQTTEETILGTALPLLSPGTTHAAIFVHKGTRPDHLRVIVAQETIPIADALGLFDMLTSHNPVYRAKLGDAAQLRERFRDMLADNVPFADHPDRFGILGFSDDVGQSESVPTNTARVGVGAQIRGNEESSEPVISQQTMLLMNPPNPESHDAGARALRAILNEMNVPPHQTQEIIVRYGNQYVSVMDPGVLEQWAWWVFADGGNYMGRERAVPFPPIERLRRLVMLADSAVSRNVDLVAGIFCAIREHLMFAHPTMYALRSPSLAAQICTESLDSVMAWIRTLASSGSARSFTSSPTGNMVLRVLPNAPGSPNESKLMLREITAYVDDMGSPTLFFTLAFADWLNGNLYTRLELRGGGAEAPVLRAYRIPTASLAQMSLAADSDPIGLARFALDHFAAVLEAVFGWDVQLKKRSADFKHVPLPAQGVTGPIEGNGRGVPHLHALVWLNDFKMGTRVDDEALRRLDEFYDAAFTSGPRVDPAEQMRCPRCKQPGMTPLGTPPRYACNANLPPPRELRCASCGEESTIQDSLLLTALYHVHQLEGLGDVNVDMAEFENHLRNFAKRAHCEQRVLNIPAGTQLDLTNRDHLVWFVVQCVVQIHYWYHTKTCWGGSINRDRDPALVVCRMLNPRNAADATHVDASGFVCFAVRKTHVWSNPTLSVFLALNGGNSDTKVLAGISKLCMTIIRYILGYLVKQQCKFDESDAEFIIAAFLSCVGKHEASGQPHTVESVARLTDREVTGMAKSSVMSLCTKLLYRAPVDLCLAACYLLNLDTRMVGSHFVVHAPIYAFVVRLLDMAINRGNDDEPHVWARALGTNLDGEVEERMIVDDADNGTPVLTNAANCVNDYQRRPDSVGGLGVREMNLLNFTKRSYVTLTKAGNGKRRSSRFSRLRPQENVLVSVGLPAVYLPDEILEFDAQNNFSRRIPTWWHQRRLSAGLLPLRAEEATSDAGGDVASSVSEGGARRRDLEMGDSEARAPAAGANEDVEVGGADAATASAEGAMRAEEARDVRDQEAAAVSERLNDTLFQSEDGGAFGMFLGHCRFESHAEEARVASELLERAELRFEARSNSRGTEASDASGDEAEISSDSDSLSSGAGGGALDEDTEVAARLQLFAAGMLVLTVPWTTLDDIVGMLRPYETVLDLFHRLLCSDFWEHDPVTTRFIHHRIDHMDAQYIGGSSRSRMEEFAKAAVADLKSHGGPQQRTPRYARWNADERGERRADFDEEPDLDEFLARAVHECQARAQAKAMKEKLVSARSKFRNLVEHVSTVRTTAAREGSGHRFAKEGEREEAERRVAPQKPPTDGGVAAPMMGEHASNARQTTKTSVAAGSVAPDPATVVFGVAITKDMTPEQVAFVLRLNADQEMAFLVGAYQAIYKLSTEFYTDDANLSELLRGERVRRWIEAGYIGSSQKRVIVMGRAGSGKTAVIKAWSAYLAALEYRSSVVRMSVFGSNASNIRGKTLAHVTGVLFTTGTSNTPDILFKKGSVENMKRNFANVVMLIVDEVYTCGKGTLLQANINLNAVLGAAPDAVFGGIGVVALIGDPCQTRPVRDLSLYGVHSEDKLRQDPAKRSRVRRAEQIYRSFDTSFHFFETPRYEKCPLMMRLADEMYSELGVSEEMVGKLNKHVVGYEGRYPEITAQSAVLCPTRTQLRAVDAELKDLAVNRNPPGTVYMWSHVDDRVDRSLPMFDWQLEAIESHFWQDTSCKVPLQFWTYAGMPISVTFNHNVDIGLSNGARGVVEEIVFSRETTFEDDADCRVASNPPEFLLVRLTSDASSTDIGYGAHVRPVVRKTERVSLMKGAVSYRYTSIPVRNGITFTVHGSQGNTYFAHTVVFNTVNMAPELMVVAFTRVTKMEDLFLMEQIPPSAGPNMRVSSAQLREMERHMLASAATAAQFFPGELELRVRQKADAFVAKNKADAATRATRARFHGRAPTDVRTAWSAAATAPASSGATADAAFTMVPMTLDERAASATDLNAPLTEVDIDALLADSGGYGGSGTDDDVDGITFLSHQPAVASDSSLAISQNGVFQRALLGSIHSDLFDLNSISSLMPHDGVVTDASVPHTQLSRDVVDVFCVVMIARIIEEMPAAQRMFDFYLTHFLSNNLARIQLEELRLSSNLLTEQPVYGRPTLTRFSVMTLFDAVHFAVLVLDHRERKAYLADSLLYGSGWDAHFRAVCRRIAPWFTGPPTRLQTPTQRNSTECGVYASLGAVAAAEYLQQAGETFSVAQLTSTLRTRWQNLNNIEALSFERATLHAVVMSALTEFHAVYSGN